jgi:hypothetical protein
VRSVRGLPGGRDVRLDAEDGLDPLLLAREVERDGAENVAVVRDRDGFMPSSATRATRPPVRVFGLRKGMEKWWGILLPGSEATSRVYFPEPARAAHEYLFTPIF